MTREAILAITETDAAGCDAINKMVQEKLGLCWHDYATKPWVVEGTQKQLGLEWHCKKCGDVEFAGSEPDRPDYAYNIQETWAIKEWLDFRIDKGAYNTFDDVLTEVLDVGHTWASALDRCKAFLLMEE